jgi:hypothetical protein
LIVCCADAGSTSVSANSVATIGAFRNLMFPSPVCFSQLER